MVVCFECHKLSQCKADKYDLQTALGHMGFEMSFPRKNIFSNIKGLRYRNPHCYGIAKAYIALV